MSKSVGIHLYVDSTLKEEAKNILSSEGISISAAVNMLFKEVVAHHGLPFDVNKDNIDKPVNIDELSEKELKEIIEESLIEVSRGKGKEIEKVYSDLKREYGL